MKVRILGLFSPETLNMQASVTLIMIPFLTLFL